jgi:CheY-like chemotaxis protein
MNIVGNAIKFTHSGSVEMRVERGKNGGIRFVVADTGIGIASSHEATLFYPFSQADPSITRKYGGTGLGLALSRNLARLMGGDLILSSTTPGKGSVFELSINDKFADDAGAPSVSLANGTMAAGNSKLQGSDALKGIKILVVDDSADLRLLVSRILGKHGAEIRQAGNGQEGVEAALAGNFDLVLMDLQMPVMDGYSATQKLREAGFQKPIVAITAHAMTEARAKAQNVGCDGHITKPLSPIDLVSTVARLAKARNG